MNNHNPQMVSGCGQFHTNEPDVTNPNKKLTPYITIDLSGVRALVDNPQQVDKAKAQWLIPSTLPSRNFKAQEESGEFWALWSDIDKNSVGLDAIRAIVLGAIGSADYEIYTSRGATPDNMKCRVLIPLDIQINGHDWVICQELLNGFFEGAGIVPDHVSGRAAQLCYLPNRGDTYESLSSRTDNLLNPCRAWAKAINDREKEMIVQSQELKAQKKVAMERKAARVSFEGVSLIDAFNEQYTVQDILIQSGYEQRGNTFKHPNSRGTFSASIKNNRVHALSSNDPLHSDSGAHDAFSAFTVLFHDGDKTKATIDAGDNWLAIVGVSFNKHKQTEWAKNQAAIAESYEPASKTQTMANESPELLEDSGDEIDLMGYEAPNDTNRPSFIDGVEYPDIEARPCYLTHEHGFENKEGQWRKAGTYAHSSLTDKEGTVTLTDTWICSPLVVQSVTIDQYHNNYGRYLQFKPVRGGWKRWCMPMDLLSGTGDALRGVLLSKGVLIDFDNQKMLPRYLMHFVPTETLEVATQTGWHKGAYILPESCIGSDDYYYQSENVHTDVPYRQAGTLAEWQYHIARYCVGNPLLVLSVCCAFAGALLKPAHQQGGGFHLAGESSKGKTTGLEVACSVHGDGSYKRTWKATGNGMEATAAMFNDGFLALDEIGECNPKEVGNIIYQVANGIGKSRANRSGGAKASYQWRVIVLSNGEVSIESAMLEAGQRVKAGQLMRLLNIPIFGKYGAFNELHDMQDGRALADHLKTASLKYHGVAGIDYLTKVVAETRNIDELAAGYTRALIGDEILSSQEGRAAKYFALVALAGELATEYGITGWSKGDACAGVKECFKQWRKSFGGGDTEDRQIKEAVEAYVEMYGDARFTSTTDDTRLHGVRSGYWRDNDTKQREWLFSKSGLMEAIKGYDLKKAVDVLKKCGWLTPDSEGRAATQVKFKNNETGEKRFYIICFDNPTPDIEKNAGTTYSHAASRVPTAKSETGTTGSPYK